MDLAAYNMLVVWRTENEVGSSTVKKKIEPVFRP
jgi:hypothetical protein